VESVDPGNAGITVTEDNFLPESSYGTLDGGYTAEVHITNGSSIWPANFIHFGATSGTATPPAVGTQLAELKGSDTVANDYFGGAVAISGTTAVVGAVGPAKLAGRAYVFTKVASGWKQVAELKGSDTVGGEFFGSSVAISGTTAVVAATDYAGGGRAYVFTDTAGVWKQVAELEGSDTVDSESFGSSVAISGPTVIVGADNDANTAGRAYVFTRTASGWTRSAELKGSDTVAGDDFGISVAISRSTAVVGSFNHADHAGRAYVFSKKTSGWKQVAELKGSDTVARDYFGGAMAISGTTAVVGAVGHASSGRAYVFTKSASGWKQVAELKGADTGTGDGFGNSVAISGTTAIVASVAFDGAVEPAYVFTKTAAGWKQSAELEGSDTVVRDEFGISVSISGTTAVVGAVDHADYAGRAYVFKV
jgi:hypothetical protein